MRLPKGLRQGKALVVGTDRDSSRNYMGKVVELMRDAPRGGVSDVTVAHDEGCACLRGLGYCDCDPDVALGTPEAFHARRGREGRQG